MSITACKPAGTAPWSGVIFLANKFSNRQRGSGPSAREGEAINAVRTARAADQAAILRMNAVESDSIFIRGKIHRIDVVGWLTAPGKENP